MIAATAAAPTNTDARQPRCVTMLASSGRNISCPAAVLPVRNPITTPRRATNQRFATIAAITIAAAPVPLPSATPHNGHRFHGAVMNGVKPMPTSVSSSAPTSVLRKPKRSMQPAENGPTRP